GRLVRQLAVESALLVLAGGLAGVLIGSWATRLIGHAASAYIPRADELTIDARVLWFAALASAVAGLAFGIVPALRLSAANANEVLREGGRGTSSIQTRRSRAALIVAECSLAMVLLAGAGLLLKSLNRLSAVDPGFDPRGM